MFNFFGKNKNPKNYIIYCCDAFDDVALNKILKPIEKTSNYVLFNYFHLHEPFHKRKFEKEMKGCKLLVIDMQKTSAYNNMSIQFAMGCAKKNNTLVLPVFKNEESEKNAIKELKLSKEQLSQRFETAKEIVEKDINVLLAKPEATNLQIDGKYNGLFLSNLTLSILNLNCNNPKFALECLQKADKCFENLEKTEQNLKNCAVLNSFLTKTYLLNNMPKFALCSSEKEIECLKQTRYQHSNRTKVEYASALIDNGNVNLQLGEQKKAVEIFVSAYKLLEQVSYETSANDQNLALLGVKLGNLYFDDKQFKSALEYYENSLKLLEECAFVKELVDVEQIENQVEVCKSEIDKKQVQNKIKEQTQTQTTSDENELCL